MIKMRPVYLAIHLQGNIILFEKDRKCTLSLFFDICEYN